MILFKSSSLKQSWYMWLEGFRGKNIEAQPCRLFFWRINLYFFPQSSSKLRICVIHRFEQRKNLLLRICLLEGWNHLFRVVFFVGEQRILEWTYSQYSESSVTFLLFNGRCNGRRSRFTARRPLCGVCTFFSSCMSGFSPVIGRYAGKKHHSFTASFSFLFVTFVVFILGI